MHLSPKAFELLTVLVEARPRALSKEDLHTRLWPDTYVTDASLGMLILGIRDALEDDARTPRFVRTVHRFGYAFQAAATTLPVALARDPRSVFCYWLITATRQVPLSPGENLVGRDPSLTVWLDSPSVSRRHARVVLDGDRVTVEDLGSKNGTHVRGETVTESVTVSDGDEIRFGSISVTFRRSNAVASTASEHGGF